MASALRTIRVTAPIDGVDLASAPDRGGRRTALDLKNFLVDRADKLTLRGPLRNSVTEATRVFTQLHGGTESQDDATPVVLFIEQDTDGNDIHPWVANRTKITAVGSLLQCTTNAVRFKVVNAPSAATFTVTSRNQSPGPMHTVVGALSYAVGLDSPDAALTNRWGGVERPRRIVRWNGVASDPSVVSYANAPKAAQDIIFHRQRLFVLGGTEPGGTTIKPNTLYFSDPVDPGVALPDTAAAWQDNITGLVNQIQFDDSVDHGCALARVGENLAIFQQYNIWMLYGYSPSTFLVRKVVEGIGCHDPRGVCEYDNKIYFLSRQGFYSFDGVEVQHLSAAVDSDLIPALLLSNTVSVTNFGNGYLCITLADSHGGSREFCALYHTGRKAWVYFTSSLMSAGSRPRLTGRAENTPWLLDDSRFWIGDLITTPEIALAQGANFVDFDRTASGGSTAAIPGSWRSRLLMLESPVQTFQLNRVLLNYLYNLNASVSPMPDMSIRLLDERDGTVLAATSVPADVSSVRRLDRFVTDVFSEAAGVVIGVDVNGASAASHTLSVPLDIYDATLVLQEARPSRGASRS